MADEDKKVYVIIKTEKKIGANGESFDYKNLVVQGFNIEETEKVFDKKWDGGE